MGNNISFTILIYKVIIKQLDYPRMWGLAQRTRMVNAFEQEQKYSVCLWWHAE